MLGAVQFGMVTLTRRKGFRAQEKRRLPELDEPTPADVTDYDKHTANVIQLCGAAGAFWQLRFANFRNATNRPSPT